MRLATARALDKSIVLIATLGLAGRQYNVPSRQFWDQVDAQAGYMVIGLITVVGVFGAFTPWETFSERSRLKRRVVMQRQILSAFGQLLEMGKRIRPAIGVNDLSLHIWRRKRTLRHPRNGELLRVATYRLGSTPLTRSFHPTKGVGVVGLCWKYDKEVGVDVSALSGDLTDMASFQEYRDVHGDDAVMGLTWEEFCRVNHRGAVFATPIRNSRSKFVGCVSLDAARGYAELNNDRLWHQLNSLSLLIGREGFHDV